MLRINGKEHIKPVTVKELEKGDCFHFDGKYYRIMHIEPDADGIRCYCFDDNAPENIPVGTAIVKCILDMTDSEDAEDCVDTHVDCSHEVQARQIRPGEGFRRIKGRTIYTAIQPDALRRREVLHSSNKLHGISQNSGNWESFCHNEYVVRVRKAKRL